MIEIFEPGTARHSSHRATQELKAASRTASLAAKAAHLDLAARHFAVCRSGGAPTFKDAPILPPLRAAFPIDRSLSFESLLNALHGLDG